MSASASGIPTVNPRTDGGAQPAQTSPIDRARALFGLVFIHLILGIIALMGLTVLATCLGALIAGQGPVSGPLTGTIFGAVFAAVGLGFFYVVYIAGPARAARQVSLVARHATEPWMLRAEWAARKVVDRSSLAVMIFLWIWTAGWCGASALIWTVNRDKIIAALNESWTDAALSSLIPLAGLIGLVAALKVTHTWWRYGASTLTIDTLPGFLGDHFRGSVAARFAQPPTRAIEVEIACERRTWRRVRDGDGHWTKEWRTVPVWSATQLVEPGRLMRTKDGMVIPIDVPLPAGQPACALDDEGAGIVWSLHVRAEEPGIARYTAHFEVPVYARQ